MSENDPAADRSNTKSALTRVRILDQAARLLSEKGYAQTTLSEIGNAAGLKAGSIYYHFESKEELVYEVFRLGVTRSMEHVRGAVGRLGEAAPAADGLRTAIRAHLESLHAQGHYSSAGLRIVEQAPRSIQQRQYVNHRHYGEYWDLLLRRAQAAGAIDPAADLLTVRLLLFGAMNSTIDWPPPTRRSIEKLTRTICLLFKTG